MLRLKNLRKKMLRKICSNCLEDLLISLNQLANLKQDTYWMTHLSNSWSAKAWQRITAVMKNLPANPFTKMKLLSMLKIKGLFSSYRSSMNMKTWFLIGSVKRYTQERSTERGSMNAWITLLSMSSQRISFCSTISQCNLLSIASPWKNIALELS